ncbi:MAG: 50S ribosomal protein L18 ['Candidatus Kapabacteria' thiocyanatum]|uniref:Large ribosomal subunit protein uL18 n=1 Tax=Candidatus Kapaibacterium thiocyanatum TaxID=1895771 RepID=A0A1M3KW66_9BACT|nr:50S ribosomal protein L18 ['Candidatus Kapabacteria' thiocyanatum]OJX56701.1 MAG: 50S ribosomal protein L18 ['Candidatus Kapabacteria' thiocyanatum]
MKRNQLKNARRMRRKMSVRRKVHGTPERYRLSIFRSVNHIYAQIVDDTTAKTLVSASTNDKEVRAKIDGLSRVEQSRVVGTVLAERAKAGKIATVAFDRGGFLYHGRVKALADAAREHGLQF